METDLEKFAESVRRQCVTIIAAASNAGNRRIVELAGALCTEAANVARQTEMARTAASPDRFDLQALKGFPMEGPEQDGEA